MDFDNIYKLQDVKDRFDQNYDFCIIDSHPSLDRLQLAVLSAADYIIIPVKPAPYSLQGMTDLFSIIQKIKKRVNLNLQILGILINQADGRTLVLEREMEETLRETYDGLVFKTKLHKRTAVEQSPALNKPITEHAPKNPSTAEFKALAKEITARIRRAK